MRARDRFMSPGNPWSRPNPLAAFATLFFVFVFVFVSESESESESE